MRSSTEGIGFVADVDENAREDARAVPRCIAGAQTGLLMPSSIATMRIANRPLPTGMREHKRGATEAHAFVGRQARQSSPSAACRRRV